MKNSLNSKKELVAPMPYVHKIVESMSKGGKTVNLCAIDLSKAFDKLNHHALLLKSMKKNLPITLLDLLEYWLNNCFSYKMELYIFWYVRNFAVRFGVRQGSVLSPILFAVYLNEWAIYLLTNCLTRNSFVVLYADDILLVTFSITELQRLFEACQLSTCTLLVRYAYQWEKSCCIRIGSRCDTVCACITTTDGHKLPWVKEVRYLAGGSYHAKQEI